MNTYIYIHVHVHNVHNISPHHTWVSYIFVQVPLPGVPWDLIPVQEATAESCPGRRAGHCQEAGIYIHTHHALHILPRTQHCIHAHNKKRDMYCVVVISAIVLQIGQGICEWARHWDRKHSPAHSQPSRTYGVYHCNYATWWAEWAPTGIWIYYVVYTCTTLHHVHVYTYALCVYREVCLWTPAEIISPLASPVREPDLIY